MRKTNLTPELRHSAYLAFQNIRQRCTNRNNKDFAVYGGRGIECALSQEEFADVFYRTDCCEISGTLLNDENRKKADGRTIDRINYDGDYSSENVRVICRSCGRRNGKIPVRRTAKAKRTLTPALSVAGTGSPMPSTIRPRRSPGFFPNRYGFEPRRNESARQRASLSIVCLAIAPWIALAVLRQEKRYGANRLEAACSRALAFDEIRCHTVKMILARDLDLEESEQKLVTLPGPLPRTARFARSASELAAGN